MSNNCPSNMSSPKYSLDDKVVAVVGCVSGIGLATVEILLKDKNVKGLALLDYNVKSGENLLKRLTHEYCSKKITFNKCDVTVKEDIERAFDAVWKTFGTVDVLINVAGIIDEKEWRRSIDVNITGVIESSLQGLVRMRRDLGGSGGTIINVASTASLISFPYMMIYSTTKYAVRSFTTNLGLPLLYDVTGVRTITFCPGATNTPILENLEQKVFDPSMETQFKEYNERTYLMKPEVTAGGLLEACVKGESASVWLIHRDELSVVPENLLSLPPSHFDL